MTLAARNTIVVIGVILTFLVLVAFAVAGYALLFGPYAGEELPVPRTQTWFGAQWQVGRLSAYRSLAAAGLVGLVSVVGVAVSARLFRRVSSAEIYFMTLFLMTLSVELLRIGQPLAEVADMPIHVGGLITRIVLFGRLVGAFSLFAAGVYSAGADYPRIGTVTALLVLLAFLIVYFVPVDSERMNATFVHMTGGREGIDLMLGFLSLGTIANYAIAWSRGHRERGGSIALAIAAVVVGKLLVLHVPTLAPLAVGAGLLIAGTASFILVNRSYFLWY